MNEEDFVVPVTGWEMRVMQPMNAAALTMKFVTSPQETAEHAHTSRAYLMHPTQLRALAKMLVQAAEHLESAPPAQH